MIINKEPPANFKSTSEVIFAHYRNLDADMLTPSAQGGISVAYQYELVHSNIAGFQLMVRIGIAVCHERDNFDRKVGRNLALNRLRAEPEPVVTPFKFKKTHRPKLGDDAAPDAPEAPAPIKYRSHNHEMTITQILDSGAFNMEDDDSIDITYGPNGDMRVPIWVNDSIESTVRGYLASGLFEDILAREGVDISGVSEEAFDDNQEYLDIDESDVDDDEDDEDDNDGDDEDGDEDDDADVTPKTRTLPVH